MKFTDIFIRRPVLATVISLLIIVMGLMAFKSLPLRQFPQVQLAQVNISSSYPGASAEIMQGFVTTPIEDAISGIDNIDYMTASSWEGGSRITLNLFPGSNADTAVSQIISKIQQIKGSNLPSAMDEPTVQKGNPGSDAIMFLSFSSDNMTPEQMGDYVIRIIRPKLQAVPGVSWVGALGSRSYAMRLWMNPQKMAATGVQPADISTAITNSNVQSTAGNIQSNNATTSVQAETGLTSAKEFNNMVIRAGADGHLVRFKDIGHAVLGASNYNNEVFSNGKAGMLIEVTNKAGSNPLDVAMGVKKLMPGILHQLPPGMHGEVVYDLSSFIKDSIHTVIETIIEAALIVIALIFLSLGSIRSVLIPMITIPISLIGVMGIMLVLGYSLNVLTLLAMVLAIGLVVDDAIVVVENISRHLEEGLSPLEASLQGAREIASPVITMTITLIAVFIPIGFSGGITGTLFSEFAFTLAGAVFISAVIALTLSPMMCARVLSKQQLEGKFVKKVDRFFENLAIKYQDNLRSVLTMRPMVLALAVAILFGVGYLYSTTQSELAPNEDQGLVQTQTEGPVNANIHYTNRYVKQISQLYNKMPSIKDAVVISGQGGVNQARSYLFLKPSDQREKSQMEIVNQVNNFSHNIAGVNNVAYNPAILPGQDNGQPVNFVLLSAGSYQNLYEVADVLISGAKKSGMFMDLQNSLALNKPTLEMHINRAKAAQMGVTSQQISDALGVMMSGHYITRFNMDGRNYYVIPQTYDKFRLSDNILKMINVTTTKLNAAGNPILVPLSNFISLQRAVKPVSLPQFQRMNAATINATMNPGYSLSDGLHYLSSTADKIMPTGMSYDYTGGSRQFMQEGDRMLMTFIFALIVIFLVLSAQFESFRDPLIILFSVPMTLFGALIPLNIGLGTINIFTQIGLLTLVGLISKHGILMVQFANQVQETEGKSIAEAIIEGATLRLRPILMTTGAMIFGVFPLLFSSHGLANSQRDIAMVIFCGMLIGTIFTLFVVPTIYTYLAHDRTKEHDFDVPPLSTKTIHKHKGE